MPELYQLDLDIITVFSLFFSGLIFLPIIIKIFKNLSIKKYLINDIFILLMYITFIIRPLMKYYLDIEVFYFDLTSSTVFEVNLLFTISMMIYLLGYNMFSSKYIPKINKNYVYVLNNRVFIALFIGISISLLSYLVMIYTYEGSLSLNNIINFIKPSRKALSNSGISSYIIQFTIIIQYLTVLYIIIKKEFNYTAIFLILLTFIILLSLGGRMQLILFILTLFFINQLYLKPIKIIKLLVYGYFILLLLAIFPIIRSLVSSDIELDDVMVRTALRFLGKDEFNMLILPFFPFIYIITGDVTSIWDMFSGLYQHIHPFNDIEWGRFISQFFTMPIPRSLYTDKPIALGTYFSQYFEQVTSRGVSLGLLGELYWSFSFFGTFIGSFIFGLIISFFDKLYLKNKYNSFIILNHSILLSFTILFYRSPMSTVVKYIFFIIIAFTILFLARRKNEKIINT